MSANVVIEPTQNALAAINDARLEAALPILEARVAGRRGDASDATVAVVRRQQPYETGPMGWMRVDAGGTLEATAGRLRAVLAARSLR